MTEKSKIGTKQVAPEVAEIANYVKRYFQDRIICLLYYGSRAFGGNESEQSDHDFYLLLSRQASKDLSYVRSIIQRYPKVDFSVHYDCYLRRKGYARFQHGNHGTFFAHYLAISKCLIGTNVFCDILNFLSPSDVKRSLLFQIEEYFWRLNRWYLYEDRTELFIKRMKKYIMRIIVDMMLYYGDLPYECVSVYSYNELYFRYIKKVSYISEKTKSVIESNIIADHVTNRAGNFFLAACQLLYEDYIRITEHCDS
jgi:hypothetical protein